MEIVSDFVFNLTESLTHKNSRKLVFRHQWHEDVGFDIFVHPRDNGKLAKILVLSEALLEDSLPSNHIDFSDVILR